MATMISDYLAAAMHHASYEWLDEEERFFGRIDGFQGVWATGQTMEDCREELADVLEEWILLRVSLHLELPTVDGQTLPIESAA
jgi:predicted RNase H-like HicB family nuclease